MSSSNDINYSVMHSDNLSNPFKNNKKQITVKNVMRSKYKILFALLVIVYIVLLISKIVSISKKNKELSSLTSENSDLQSKITALEVSTSELNKKSSPIQSQVDLLRKNRDALVIKLNDVENKQRYTIKESKLSSPEEAEMLKAKTKEYEEDINRLNDLTDHYNKKLAMLTDEYNSLIQNQSNNDIGRRDLPEKTTNKYPLNQMDSIILNNTDSAKNQFLDYPTRLIYRASRDGFMPEIFHSKCDNAQSTLVVTQLRSGLIIIGYTEQSWSGNYFKKDNNAYLHNLSIDRKYKVTTPENAIYCDPNRFAVFGNGDFVIQSPVYSNFPHSYGDDNCSNLELTLGTQTNDISELEVLEVLK